jgi:transcriptional regulator with XRE-family HTH domain
VTLRAAKASDIGDPAEPRSLAEAVMALRKRAGSHDKLAAQLSTSRQRVIDWEKGTSWPSARYREKLRELGVPERLLIRPTTLDELAARARQIVGELAALRVEIRKLQ